MSNTIDNLTCIIGEHIQMHYDAWKNLPMRDILYPFLGDTFTYNVAQIPLSELLLVADKFDDLIVRWEHEALNDPSIQIPVECHSLLNNSRFFKNDELLNIHFEKWIQDTHFFENAVRLYMTSSEDNSIVFAKKLIAHGLPYVLEDIFPSMRNVNEMQRLEANMPTHILEATFQNSFSIRNIFDNPPEYYAYIDELAEKHKLQFQSNWLPEPAVMKYKKRSSSRRPLSWRKPIYNHLTCDPVNGTNDYKEQHDYKIYKRNRKYTQIAVYQAALSNKCAYIWYDPESTDLEKCIAWVIDQALTTNVGSKSYDHVDPYKQDPKWTNVEKYMHQVQSYILPLTMEQPWSVCIEFWESKSKGSESLDDTYFIL